MFLVVQCSSAFIKGQRATSHWWAEVPSGIFILNFK